MLKADLHVHSRFSKDSDSHPADILEAALSRQLDVLAVTDHNSLQGSRAVRREVDETGADIVLIPGQEVSTYQGHLLVLGPDEPAPRATPDDVIRWTRDRGGICIAPHPFQKYRHGLGKKVLATREAVDGVEVCNSRHLVPIGDHRTERLARKYGYPRIGGSDAHIPEMVGRVHTLIDADPSIDAVLHSIRKGKTEVVEGKTPPLLFLKQLAETFSGRLLG